MSLAFFCNMIVAEPARAVCGTKNRALVDVCEPGPRRIYCIPCVSHDL